MTAEIANTMAQSAHNLTLGAMLMLGTSLLNLVCIAFLVISARMNLKTARALAEVSRPR